MARVYVVGVGLTKIGRHFDKGLVELAAEAYEKAVEDAGIEPAGLIVANMMASSLQGQDSLGALIASSIGLRYRPAIHVEAACGSGGAAIYTAYSLVASGLLPSIAVIGVEKMTDYPTAIVTEALAQAADADYEVFYGASFAALNALMMRYYMQQHNATRDEMSEWPVMMHENALKNPYAQLHKRITRKMVAESQVIADPIRLLDSSPIGDGAAALILASSEEAEKTRWRRTVEVAGVGLAVDTVELSNRQALDEIPALRHAASQAYSMARLTPRDIDVAEIHDAFTITAILSIEALGFTPKGEAAKQLARGRFHPGDKPTLNPSGGLKARGHPVGATGVYQVAEIAMQLRGDYPGVRVDNPRHGLASNIGGDGSTTTTIILSRR